MGNKAIPQSQPERTGSRVAAVHVVNEEDPSSKVIASITFAICVVEASDEYLSKTDEERLKLIIGVVAIFRAWEEAYIQHEIGYLDDRSWKPMLSYYTFILSSPPGRKVWELRKQHFDDRFREFADGLESMEYSLT